VTFRNLEQRMKEHQDACREVDEGISGMAEYAWNKHHPTEWQKAKTERASRNRELRKLYTHS